MWSGLLILGMQYLVVLSMGQSIIDSSHPDHTQNAHRGTLSTLSSLSLDEQLKVIDSALNQVASQRAELGATTNRLAYTYLTCPRSRKIQNLRGLRYKMLTLRWKALDWLSPNYCKQLPLP